MAQISVPDPTQYTIDSAILEDLMHEVDPRLDDRPEAWTRASIALAQPGLELLVSGFRVAWHSSPNARRAALRILSGLVNAQQPPGRVRPLYLREMLEGYRLSIKTTTGSAAARLFVSNMLGGVD